jgi:TolB-like protein/class 3 adenylate cyclase
VLPGEERRLAAIVEADVVGYSRLVGLDEEGTIARLRAHRAELIDPKISEFDGRIVKTMGDGLLLEFHSVVNATRCAIAIQAGMAARNAGADDDRRIEFRIGINLGDVVVDGDDIYGDGVNVAARLEALAEPGGICLSRSARDQVLDRLDAPLEDLGMIEVKNIARPVQVFRIVLDGSAAAGKAKRSARFHRYGIAAVVAIVVILYSYDVWFGDDALKVEPATVERMAHALPDKPSVAVLPFDNMSGDKAQDYFADGMIEDLITDLSKISGLFVIARNSTFTYKGRAVKVQQVAEDLGVRYVVEGSVRRSSDKVRINVQLIDALSGHHLWAERYDGTMADIFDLQDRITKKIVTALAVTLLPGEAKATTALGRKETDSPAAYDAVLLGWNYLRLTRVDPNNFVLARAQFEKALRLDPDYNRAHLSMAAVYWWSAWQEQYVRMEVAFQEGVDLAKSYLKTAMRTPSALGHRIRAEMYRWEGQFDTAIAETDLAIALDPNNPEGYGAKASAQTHAGQAARALKNLAIADRLDPENLKPNWLRRGKAHFFLGHNDEAAALLRLSISAEPEFSTTYQYLIAAYGHLGRKAEAKASIETLNRLRQSYGDNPFTVEFAVGLARLKRKKDKEYYRSGLQKAGVEPGGDVESTKLALDSFVSRTKAGYFNVRGATTVIAKEVKALLGRGAVVFDMRGSKAWGAGHLDGAYHANKKIGEFSKENLANVVKKTQPIAFYCSGFT